VSGSRIQSITALCTANVQVRRSVTPLDVHEADATLT
jgi:hypothetical protein